MARRIKLSPEAAALLAPWYEAIEKVRHEREQARVLPPISQTPPKPPPKGIAALRALGWRILPLPRLVVPSDIGCSGDPWLKEDGNGWVAIPPAADALRRRFPGRNAAIHWAGGRNGCGKRGMSGKRDHRARKKLWAPLHLIRGEHTSLSVRSSAIEAMLFEIVSEEERAAEVEFTKLLSDSIEDMRPPGAGRA